MQSETPSKINMSISFMFVMCLKNALDDNKKRQITDILPWNFATLKILKRQYSLKEYKRTQSSPIHS